MAGPSSCENPTWLLWRELRARELTSFRIEIGVGLEGMIGSLGFRVETGHIQ
jgi:hypothetical protein